jgi:tetratricopeptide (TPR) repeat protein
MTMPVGFGPAGLGPDGSELEGLGVLRGPGVGAAVRQQQDKAYFLDLLGDSHNGLGHPDAAIEAYQQAASAFEAQGASCSYALCLLKVAECHMSLEQPGQAAGYLEACLPLLRDLGLTRYANRAQHQLDACQVGLAQARLLGEGRGGPWSSGPGPPRPAS